MIVHTAWLGEPSDTAAESVNCLRRLDRSCDVRFYADGSEVWPAWRQAFDGISNNPRMQSDILRHSVLRRHGGLWLDLDVILTISPQALVAGWNGYTLLRLMPGSPWAATDVIFSPANWSGWALLDEYISSIDTSQRLSHLAFAHDMILWAYRRGAPVTLVDDARRYPCRPADVTSEAVAFRCGNTPTPGLGDMVSAGLAAVGITEERVSKLIGRPCGCGKRAEALNRLGAKLGIGGKPAKDA